MKSITIENTKGIKSLKFKVPNNNAVYLIVGSNGAGKTTLLVCLDRICNPYAFARGFSCPKSISGYDEYSNSQIKFENESMCVVFRKKKSKWAATPRKDNAQLLKQFGFASSVFIKADSRRIDATQEEIKKGSIQSASANIKQSMNEIFETDRFQQLRVLKVSNGRGKTPSLFNIIKDGTYFYTEKRFSTGELAILHLLQSIEKTTKGSLVLLDEAEIALHPRVQIKLLNYLQKISKEKNLMVLISTHSPTLIKAIDPKNILMLDPDSDGNISVVTPCYPTRALGRVDYEESAGFDYVFFVEDDMARIFLKKLVNKYIKIVLKHSTSSASFVPVGGFYETARMAVQTKDQLLNKSKVYAFVDADAFDDLDEKPLFKELYKTNSAVIKDLTITPEIKFIDVLTANDSKIKEIFKAEFHCEPATIKNSEEYKKCNSPKIRKAAKDRFDVFVNYCCRTSGDNEQIITDKLIDIVVNTYNDGEVQHILGPIFNC